MAVGTALAVAQLAAAAAPAIAEAIPGRMERAYRKDIMADRERLAKFGGGMSAGQTQQAIAEGMAGVQAQQEEAAAQVARGSATGSGASGMQAQMAGGIQKAVMGAGNQVRSTVRQQSLDLGEQQRQGLQDRMLQTYSDAAKRKGASLDRAQDSVDPSDLYGMGEQQRKKVATDVAGTAVAGRS